jgi:hypothetical protein
MGESISNEGSAMIDRNALPNRDPPDVTRIKAAAAKRVQAHRARARMGLRCPHGSGAHVKLMGCVFIPVERRPPC